MKEHEINKLDNFIGAWYLENISICDELIEYHKNSPNKGPGNTYDGDDHGVVKHVKDSIDCHVLDDNLGIRYLVELQKVANEYIKKYPYCNSYGPWTLFDPVQIQHYLPGGAYFKFHTERGNNNPDTVTRHLVYMTYLNDVTDQGETEFYHQKLKVKPEKGLTLIWPSDWTFTHRGIPSPSQEKYITTGWYHYSG